MSLALAAAAPGAGPALTAEQARHFAERMNAQIGLESSRVVQLDIDTRPGQIVHAVLPVEDDVAFTLNIWPHSVRAEGYRLLAQVGRGELVEMTPGPVRTVRGQVLEVPQSRLAGGMDDDGLTASIVFPGGKTYHVEPVARWIPEAPVGTHVVYEDVHVIPHAGACGTDDMRLPDVDGDEENPPPAEADGAALGTLYCAQLGCDADREYFLFWGSVTAVENRINAVTNAVNNLYETQVNITHDITVVIVRTVEPDPYSSTDSGTLLCQFITEWTQNQQQHPFDVAKLFTGKELNGGTIGQAATIGDICDRVGSCGGFSDDGAYCISQSDCCGGISCASDLMAHELGHLWDAVHCDPCSETMRSFIGCFNNFTTPTENLIIAHRNSRTCLNLGACPVPNQGACCLSDGECVVLTETNCNSFDGVFQGGGSVCDPDPCVSLVGACCLVDGSCLDLTTAECSAAGGTFQGIGVSCSLDPCPTGACCFASGGCADIPQALCIATGGLFVGVGFPCTPNPCPQPQGACCLPSGACEIDSAGDCALGGGEYQGDNSVCSPNPCPQPTGACCFTDGSCTSGSPSACASAGGTYEGDGSACSPNPCPQPPACPEDLDGSGAVDFPDLLQVLAAWGPCSSCPQDLDGSGDVAFPDLLAVLAAWGPCE
jgi:hypothetical protein